MQPWQQAQVNDPESEHHGRAGLVEAVTTDEDGNASAWLRLDARDDTEGPAFVQFPARLLRLL